MIYVAKSGTQINHFQKKSTYYIFLMPNFGFASIPVMITTFRLPFNVCWGHLVYGRPTGGNVQEKSWFGQKVFVGVV